MPTGGVTLQTAADFLRAGACALGIGGAMVEPRAIVARDFARIELVARQYVEVVRKTRKDGRQ
jgi:2-dehydro-3-deoxyphosphogluconate aldolase/(4S)-4-hydroxy-2-oxoglutarate aldolase